MLRWMLGNLLVWAVLFFGVPYAGVRFVPPEAGMMFTMALWLAVYPLYIALASHSAAQRKWNTLWVRLLGSGLGHAAPPPAPGTAGAEQGFSIERRKGRTVWMLSMLFCFYVEMETERPIAER